jgi:hypothetical protein
LQKSHKVKPTVSDGVIYKTWLWQDRNILLGLK